MAPRLEEHCENCLKHSAKRHGDPPVTRCGNCIESGEYLRRCASCKLVRYCSRECQKAHWKEHQHPCRINVEIHLGRERLGPVVEERQKTFEKWCEKNARYISSAAVHSLELMKDRERTESNIFLVHLDVLQKPPSGVSSKPKFVRTIRQARCTPLAEAHQMFSWRFRDGHVTFDRDLAPRARAMRVLIVDDGLPVPLDLYTIPMIVPENMSLFPWDPNWLLHFKQAVNEKL